MAARRENLSGVDTAWLHMEDSTNLMMITGVLIFSEPLDYDRLVDTVQKRLLHFRRFRQRVAESRLPMSPPRWEDDPHFDLRAHIHRMALPEPVNQETLEEIVSNMMSAPLDYSKPLWQFHLIENYQGGSVLLGRLHHAIADGIALMRVLLSLTDESPEPVQVDEDSSQRTQARSLATMAGSARVALHGAQSIIHESVRTVRDSGRRRKLARLGFSSAATLGKLVLRWPDPGTIFKGDLGVIKKVSWSRPFPLQDVKAIGKVTGGTVNDVLLTATTGALRRYMIMRGQKVDGMNFRAIVPINLRPLDGPIELGNKFGMVFLSLPVGIGDPVERLTELKRRMDSLKSSPEAVVVMGLLSFFGKGPSELEKIAVEIFGTKATSVMTNVPGPSQPIYMAGAKLDSMMFWVPQSGHLGLGVSIISYAGRVWLGVTTDAGLVPDPRHIISAFHEEFDYLMDLVYDVDEDPQEEAPTPPASHRCRGVTKAGENCRNRAQTGSEYCHVHQPA